MPNPTDVPEICDLILNGERYMFALTEDSKAVFGYTPPFVPRYSVDTQYGDNEQDFWYSFTQKDWSLGEQQKFQSRSDDGQRRYWRGKAVDVSVPGEASLTPATSAVTFAANPKCAVGIPGSDLVYFATSTNLYHISNNATITGDGAHGLGVAPSRFGIALAGGGTDIFVSSSTGGTNGVRRWNGAAFVQYSATGADSLAFLNNTLYGFNKADGKFYRYTPGGAPVAATEIYSWKNPEAVILTGIETKLVPFGGKLVIMRYRGEQGPAELWIYDGQAAPSKVTEFPPNFSAYDCCTYAGTVFVSGLLYEKGNAPPRPTVMFYKDGETGIVWQSPSHNSLKPPLAVLNNGLVIGDTGGFDEGVTPRVMIYNADTGAYSTAIEATSLLSTDGIISCGTTFALIIPNSSSGTSGTFYGGTSYSSSGEVESSRIDFGNSLNKLIRGITVFYRSGGGSSTFDLEYQADDGGWVSVQTGLTSGLEYKIAAPTEGTTHKYVQYKVKFNLGSGDGSLMALRKVLLRGIPIKPSYAQRIYHIMLIGKDGEGHQEFYNGEKNPKDGKQQHQDLQTAAQKTQFFSVTDTMGTYSGIIEKINVLQVRKDEFIAEVTTREV